LNAPLHSFANESGHHIVGFATDGTGKPLYAWSNGEVTHGLWNVRLAVCPSAERASDLCSFLSLAHPYAYGNLIRAFFETLSRYPELTGKAFTEKASSRIGATLSRSERAVCSRRICD
jgi:hypothetical protein